MKGVIVGVVMLLAAGTGLARAGQPQATDGRFLGREEIRLYGLNLTVTPAEQVVPKDIATIVSVFLQAPSQTDQTVSPFSPDAEVRATLRGPSFATPIELAVKPGNPFNIPAMKIPGIHTLDNIRLVSNGEVLLRGNPESARIEVIEKLLVSQVTARALTADEIREKGIVFDKSNFQAYNFSAAFAIQDTPITINFPVLLPRLTGAELPGESGVSIPAVSVPSIPQLSTIIPDTLKLQTRLPNLQVVGFSLKVPNVENGNLIVPPIPGIIAIPGDIGFLNQYFSVLLMVGNVAPAGSGLVVSELSADILLPAGRDNVPNTPDDPLRMAMTSRGESPRVQVVAQAGPDGRLGTADDITTIGPGQSGNAEYLVEGRREGSHVVEMRMHGILNGLPVGPVPIDGVALGSVLVRNPTFALTFTHPEVVSAGEKYTLDVTVTNTSSSPANFVSINLDAAHIGGAKIAGDMPPPIDTIAPGDSATVSFPLEAKLTGRVFAATLDADEGVTGQFALKTSVGELGVPLSPDSLVLPKEASTLPKPLRDAAIGLLGKAWAVATAPAAAVPADLQRFSRKIVLDRAVEVAEAGLRLSLQEPLRDSAAQLALDFLGSNFPRLNTRVTDAEGLAFEQSNYTGFDLLRRRSIRGDVFADAVAALLRDDLASLGAAAFHGDVASKISYRPGTISVLAAAPGGGAAPVRLAIATAAGLVTGGADANGKVLKQIAFSEVLQFKDVQGTLTGEMALVGAPEPGTFTVRLTRAPGVPDNTPFTLSLVVPGANDELRQIVFDNLVVGQRPVVSFANGAPYRLVVEWTNASATADATPSLDAVLPDPAPSVISVIQNASADQILCDQDALVGPRPGRIIAVLFSEEVTPASVQDKAKIDAITNYAIDGNAVVGVALQPGRRIAYIALRDPFGPLVPRSLTVSHVTDARGHVIAPQTRPMTATVTDEAGVVSGQVLKADGTPAAYANVRLFYRSPCESDEVSWIGISSKTADAQGRYSWDFVLAALPARIVAVDAESGDVRDVRFHVRANGQRLNVNVVFLGRGTLTGRTFAADGRTPLADTFVRVTSLTDQSQFGARTDSAGRYTIANVPVGNIVIDAVNTAAVAKTTESDLIPFAGATTTRDLILLDASHEPITIKRGNLTGFVLESDARTPARGVPVIVYYQSNSQPSIPCPKQAPECPVAVATTDANGAFQFPNVVAGSLRLQTFNQSSYEQGEVGLVLAANQSLSANIVLAGGLGTVRGIVLDPSGRPVAGAAVGGGLSLTTTGADGRFTLTDVPVGHREIVAVSQELGSRASVTVDLLYGGQEVNATLVLDALASVSGIVRTAAGQAAPGIQVYVFDRQGDSVQVYGSAVTNEQGGYRIDGLPLGNHTVSAFSADFSDGNLVPAVLKFHRQVVLADVKFRGGGGRVTGRVLADDGATPLRARVSVSGEQVVVAGGVLGVEFRRVENFRIVDTNLTTGKYSIAGIFVGPFTLRAAGPFSPDPIAVEATMPAPDQEIVVDLKLQPTSRLTGTVFMPDGTTPVGANVPVHFKSDSFKTVCSESSTGESICESFPQGVQGADAVTDATGTFLFPVLNAGTYTLTVDGPGGRTAMVKGSLIAGQQGRADVRLLARAEIEVRVRAADAETPIPGARVDVSQVGAPIKKASFQAGTDGIVTFGGADAFSEGDIVVVATDLRNGATGRARGRITTDGTTVKVDVYLATTSGVVFGRVVRPNGTTPVPNAEVIVSAGSDAVAFATTDADGKYREIGIPLGPVRVDVFEAATARRGAASGQLATNGAQIELNVVEEALGVVRGRVVAAVTLQPLVGWRVTLTGVSSSGRAYPSLVGTTGIDGGFSFPGAPLGRFTINATKPGEPGSGSAQGSIVREGELVDVPVIATIPRQAVGTFTGTVVDHLGEPVANARVEVFAPGAEGPTANITADGTGRFSYGPAPLGRYRLRAFRQGSSESGTASVELSFDGQSTGTSVVLNGLSTVSGVVMQNNAPVPNARVTLKAQPDAGCGASCSGFANGSGQFTFERVSARSFTVIASDANGVLQGSTGDVLNPGETKNVTVVLETTRRLTGRVVNAAGLPVAGVVGEVTIGTRHFFGETASNGAFEFAALPLGAYKLDLRDATGPGMAARLGTIASDVLLGDITLDEAPPRVSGVTPLPSAVAVPRAQAITLVFSEPIDRASISTDSVQLAGPSGPVLLGTPVYRAGDSEVVFQPSGDLQPETRYTLTVTGVRDRAGRPMVVPYAASFTTVDITAPTLVDASPAGDANGVSAFTTIRLRYSEALVPPALQTPASQTPAVQLFRGTTPVEGRVDFILGNTVIVFTPNMPLAEDATYRVVAPAATDLSGNKQPQGLDYTFSTTDRTPPQVTALVAAGDGTVIENGLTEVTALVGNTHDVAYVDFYLNDQIAFSARTAPFKLALKAVPALGAPGASIKVSAFATDTSGNRSPAPATILVPIKADAPPAVTLLTPAAGTSVPNGSLINISLRATDDLALAQVGYRATIGQTVRTGVRVITPAATETTQAFEFLVPADAAPGAIVKIEPTAVDSKGQAILGAAVDVRVLDAAPPKVTITGVTSGARVRPGQTTTVVVSATDAGLVRTVTFTASGAATFTQTRTIDPAQGSVAASFTFTVPESATATETITLAASAKDSAGNEADAPNVILPIADLVAPTITLRTSTGRNEMSPGSPLVLIAEANDEVGVGRIELTGSGAFPVAEGRTIDPPAATAEATFTILVPETVPNGAALQLQARAIDGAQNVSAPIALTVTAGVAAGVTLPASAIVNAGSTQTFDVALTAAAGASGVRVDLSTEHAAIATVSTPVLFAQGEGTTPKTATITALAGGSTTIIASVQGVERARMTVTVQGGIVTGVVRDPNQLQPVAGALVTVIGGGVTRTATSDSDGTFTVQGVPGPHVEVRALHEASGLYGVSNGTMAVNGYLELDVILLDAGSVHGVVRAANNAPVGAGVEVSIMPTSGSTPEQTVFTNAQGEYEFPLVTVGNYRLDASDQAGNRATTTVSIAGGQQLPQDLVFLGRGTVRGIVKTATGDAVPGAALAFSSTSIFGPVNITRTADGDGKFEFTGVFVGSFSVTASRAATGEAGTAGGAIAADQSTADVVVTLSPVGSLSGIVRRTDQSTVPGASVSVGALTTTTDPNGRYEFAFVPAGAVKATAGVTATREQGFARGTIVAGQPAALDIVLVPQGRLQVTVSDAENHTIAGASVSVTVSAGTYPDQLGDQLAGTTGANGIAVIDRVMAGSYAVTASANGLNASVSGSLAGGETKPVAIKLQPVSTVTGTVYEAGGQQRATRGFVTLRDVGYVAIAADGTYTFTGVPAGTYQAFVSVDSMLRAQATVVVPNTTGTVTRDFTLVGLGTVRGRVMNGGNPVGDTWVQVVAQHPDFGTTQNVKTNAAGFYEAISLAFGPIAVSAGSETLRGEAFGTLASSTVPLVLDILLTNNATTLPQTLNDANGSRFDMQTNGGLGTASSGFYNAFLLDIIAGGTPVRFAGAGIPTNENGGREIATRQNGIAGLNVTRKMFVPSSGYFGRWLEILSNPTDAAITVDVRVTSVVGTSLSNPHPTASIIATSSGDTALDVTSPETADRWVVLDDAKDVDPNVSVGCCFDSGIPAVAFVFDGAGAATRAGQAALTVDPNSSLARNTVQYTWQSVTIPAGQSVALMHFGVRQMSRAGAAASAERLVQLPPEALSALNPDEIPLVRNFAVPVTGNSTLTPLAPVTGKVTGKALAGDGTTPIAGVKAKFKSDSLFFGRTYTLADSAADGTFTLQGVTGTNAPIGVSMGDGFTLTAAHPESLVDAPPVSAAFEEGQTQKAADIVFSNTGLVQGLLKRHDGTPVTSGTVKLMVGASTSISRTIGATSRFLYTGIPAGTFPLTATYKPTGTSGDLPNLTGSASVTVAAGRTETQDVLLEPTNTVTGLVKTAADQSAVGVTVYLERSGFQRSTTTDSGGRYTFANAPAGALTVRAVEPTTQVSSSVTVTLAADTPPLEAPGIKLMGYGTLNLTVTYVGGTPVGAGVSVVVTEVARTSGPRGLSTNASGQVTVPNVTTAGYSIRATVPTVGAQSQLIEGTLAHGESKSVAVPIPGIGLVTARLRFPDQSAPGAVPVDIYTGSTRSFTTNSAGDATIPYVTTSRTFSLTGFTSAAKRVYRQVSSLQVTEGQNLPVDVTLPALATLAVTLEPGDPARVGAKVAIRDAFSFGYGTPVTVNQAGTATFASTPEGRVLIAVTSAAGVLLAETEATIRPADHARTVEVRIGNGVPLPQLLKDANSFEYTVDRDGRYYDQAYYDGLQLRVGVDGGEMGSFLGGPLAEVEAGGRELVLRDSNAVPGVELTRKVFVPKTGYFARYLELVRNPGATPVTVDLAVSGYLASSWQTMLVDQVPGAWIVTDDDDGNSPYPQSLPTLAHVYAGQNAAFAPPATVLPSSGDGAIEYRWNGITIEPGQTIAVMHFSVQQASQTAGLASATRLADLPPEALADLSPAEIAEIGNFAVPADGVGAVPPLNLVADFTVSGQLFTWNGTTPAGGSNDVTLRSGHPIYSRGTTVTTGASYSVTGTVVDSWTVEVNNAPPAPFEGWKTPRQTTHDLQPGQTSATENITFSGTGTLTGQVRFPNAPANFGSLQFSLGSGQWVNIGNFDNGAFTLPIVPVGSYTMTASVNGRNVTVPVDVAADANTAVDLRLPARASVRVRVRTPQGGPSANAKLWIYPGSGFERQADENGEFTFTNQPEGEFWIYAQDAAGHSLNAQGVVAPTDEGKTLDLPLQFRGLITMRVTATRAGQPVEGLQVQIDHGDGTGSGSFGQTDASGRVVAEYILTGGYDVRVLNADGSVVTGRATGSVPSTADGQTIDVPVALATETTHVTGTLFAADGQTRLRNFEVGIRLFDGTSLIGTTTVSNGAYDLADVPTPSSGTLRIRAHYPSWNDERFVEATVSVANGQTATQDFTLPINGITGTVRLWDGSRPSYANIRVNFGGESSYSSSLDADGRYVVFDVPLLPFVASVWTDELNGRIAGEVTSATEMVTADFIFGRITGTVRFADGSPVPYPSVFALQVLDESGTEETYYSEPTGEDGTFEIRGPQPGQVTVIAQDDMVVGQTMVTLSSGTPTAEAHIQLEPDGTISGVLVDRHDVPVADAEIALSLGAIERFTTTDVNGRFTFARAKLGGFFVQAKATIDGQVQYVAAGGVLSGQPASANVALKFPALVTLTGQVLPRTGDTPVAEAEVRIESRDHAGPLGSYLFVTQTDANGTYTAPAVPAGQVTVTAFDSVYGGSVTGTVTEGAPAALNVRVGSLVRLSPNYELASGAYRFDVTCQGRIYQGGRTDGLWWGTYVNAFNLLVDGVQPPCLSAAGLEDNGRELSLDAGMLENLHVTRKISVPEAGGYARYLEVLTNPGTTARTVSVAVVGGMGSWSQLPSVVTSPSTTGNTFAVMQFQYMGAIGFVFAGQNSVVPAVEPEFVSTAYFSYSWNVTLQPGQTVALMHFALQGPAQGGATVSAAAQEFASLARSGMLDGLSAQEKAWIVNFRVQ